MKNNATRFFRGFFFLFAIFLFSLPMGACSRKAPPYSDSLSCSELMDTVEAQIPVPFGYETFSTDQIRFYFEDRSAHDDACLRFSKKSENINEVGILHTPSGKSIKETEEAVTQYLTQMKEEQSAFIAGYAPEELSKLEEAEWRSFGNYTVYAILESEERQLVFETVEKKLSETES